MKNYAMLYHLSDKKSEDAFLNAVQKKFNKHRMLEENGLKFFAFAEKNLSGVQDAIQKLMDTMTFDYPDYIALFYTREEEPDLVNRLMIYGRDNRIENELKSKNISDTIFSNTLADLLEFNFTKAG